MGEESKLEEMKFQTHNLRTNMVRVRRKTLTEWWREFFARLVWGYRSFSREREEGVKLSILPAFWHYEMGPVLHPGDPGYEEATCEIGFLTCSQGFERCVPGPFSK